MQLFFTCYQADDQHDAKQLFCTCYQADDQHDAKQLFSTRYHADDQHDAKQLFYTCYQADDQHDGPLGQRVQDPESFRIKLSSTSPKYCVSFVKLTYKLYARTLILMGWLH